MLADTTVPPPPDASRCRVFFALWPDKDVAHALRQRAASMAPPEARKMRRDTLHLTLAFVGDIAADALPALMRVGDRTAWPSFTLEIDRIGHWPHNRIVWAGSTHTPKALAELAASLHTDLNAIGIALPERDFVPHVTLARKATALTTSEPKVEPVSWHVHGGVLVASTRTASGAAYRVLKRWSSAPSAASRDAANPSRETGG